MKQLTINEIAPYLPYKVKVQWYKSNDKDLETSILTASNYSFLIDRHNAIPILRPLSDLTKEIEYNGERFVPILALLNYVRYGLDGLDTYYNDKDNLESYVISEYKNSISCYEKYNDDKTLNIATDHEIFFEPYYIIEKLLEWHFDIFSLIPQNLAVDINTLNK